MIHCKHRVTYLRPSVNALSGCTFGLETFHPGMAKWVKQVYEYMITFESEVRTEFFYFVVGATDRHGRFAMYGDDSSVSGGYSSA